MTTDQHNQPGGSAYAGSGATAATPTSGTTTDTDTRSLGEIVSDVANDLTTLVKQEIELAKTEAKNEATAAGKKAGKGVGLLGGAGLSGNLALVFLSLALMFMLDSWMHTGWAALIVGALWAIAAAVMALRGKKELQEINPPKLETTQETLKEDAEWARQQKNG